MPRARVFRRMPTVRQQRALGRADQDFGSGCSPLATATKLCSPPCATASARARPITSRGHRRVERAAKVALPRLFIPSPCCTRAPGSPTTSGVCPFWGVLGVLDVVAGFSRCSALKRPIRLRHVNPLILAQASQKSCNRCFTARASVRTDSARRESYQQRSTTAKTQALRRAATKVAS